MDRKMIGGFLVSFIIFLLLAIIIGAILFITRGTDKKEGK